MYKDFAAFQTHPMDKHPTPAPYTTCDVLPGAQIPDTWAQSNCADGQRCTQDHGCVLTCETDDDYKALFGSNNPGEDKATLKCGVFRILQNTVTACSYITLDVARTNQPT